MITDIRFKQATNKEFALATLFVLDLDQEELKGVAYIPVGKIVPTSRWVVNNLCSGDFDFYERLTALELVRVISDETMHYVLHKIGEKEADFDNAFAVLFTWFDYLVVEDFFLALRNGAPRLREMGAILSAYHIEGEEDARSRFLSYACSLIDEYRAEAARNPKRYSL